MHKQSLTSLQVRCRYTEIGETPSTRPRARAPGHQSSCLHSGRQCLRPAGSPLAVGLPKCRGHELFHRCTGAGRMVANTALNSAGLGLQAIELRPHYHRLFGCASSRPATQWGLLFDSIIGCSLDWSAFIIQLTWVEAGADPARAASIFIRQVIPCTLQGTLFCADNQARAHCIMYLEQFGQTRRWFALGLVLSPCSVYCASLCYVCTWGLTSRSAVAFHVVKRLRLLAKSGRTLLISIHQPAQEFFDDARFSYPPFQNPSDHFLWVINLTLKRQKMRNWGQVQQKGGEPIGKSTIYFKLGQYFDDIQARPGQFIFVTAFLTFMGVARFPSFIEDMKSMMQDKWTTKVATRKEEMDQQGLFECRPQMAVGFPLDEADYKRMRDMSA
ncbi:hypothetical protein GOP47_0007259 [Adiantum capillus-veneris]|uniref:Uncharacterized protein n=1 Tax=Adiantum capillus-veneris TaxID=13818 RepID=A0A9D4V0Z2_ADICA|nr:hypothetical protein GOP47_0007259 [Adiantum capillus-veneris]